MRIAAIVFAYILILSGCSAKKHIMKNCEKAQSDFYICDEAN